MKFNPEALKIVNRVLYDPDFTKQQFMFLCQQKNIEFKEIKEIVKYKQKQILYIRVLLVILLACWIYLNVAF